MRERQKDNLKLFYLKFLRNPFIYNMSGSLMSEIHMGRVEYKVKGGKLIKIQLSSRDNKIEKIKIMGDFFLHPEEFIDEIEEALLGQPLHEVDLAKFIGELMEKKGAVLLGAFPEDFAKCIVMAGEINV